MDLHYVVLLLPWEYLADAEKWKTKKSQIEAAWQTKIMHISNKLQIQKWQKTPRIHKTTKHSSQNSHKSSGNWTMTQVFPSCRNDTCWWIELRWIMDELIVDTPIHSDPFYPLDCFVGSSQSGTWCNDIVGNVNDASVNKQFFATRGIHEGHWCLEWGVCHFCLWSFIGICSCQLCFKVRCGRQHFLWKGVIRH